jgi:5'-AMP-activated protein kinase catalytic alpha subunit
MFLAGVFPIPDYLNKYVVSLLCHMLQTDPMKRATAEDIHKHDWFSKDLATYLFPDRDINVAVVDHEALATVCEKFSVETKEIEDILDEGDYQNPLAIAYRLIIDNKRIEGEHAIEEFK